MTAATPARSGTPQPEPRVLTAGLLAALAVVAALTLVPDGRGWDWGSPAAELRWYVTGWDSPTIVAQLVGNLALLAVPAVLAVLRWPALGRPARLAALALATAAAIELLQWALPLGRVVSPLDALLNATGAVVAGLLMAAARRSIAARGPGGGRVRAQVAVVSTGDEHA